MEKKEPSPISVVWRWAEKYHSKFYGSVVLTVLGVAGTMLAYFSIAAIHVQEMFTIPKESAIVLEFVFLKYRGVINND